MNLQIIKSKNWILQEKIVNVKIGMSKQFKNST